jgi:RNA ligase (TIGR02306 family)
MNNERKLVVAKLVDAVTKHPNADSLDILTIGGWKIVAKLGEFKVGELVAYHEIDSWLPAPNPSYQFLMKPEGNKTYNGVEGSRLRTIKLRGQLSQGLALPLSCVPLDVVSLGQDLTEVMGVQKWEAPVKDVPANAKGSFPEFLVKTNQERCQNIVNEIFVDNADTVYEVTIKMDGSSATYFIKDGVTGACSRNLELKTEGYVEEGAYMCGTNNFLNVFFHKGVKRVLEQYYADTGHSIAIQGEVVAPNIQGNSECVNDLHFFVFDIFDIDKQEYLKPVDRWEMVDGFNSYYGVALEEVPLFQGSVNLKSEGVENIDQLLYMAIGKGYRTTCREGLVFKAHGSDFSFKVISNEWLLQNKG